MSKELRKDYVTTKEFQKDFKKEEMQELLDRVTLDNFPQKARVNEMQIMNSMRQLSRQEQRQQMQMMNSINNFLSRNTQNNNRENRSYREDIPEEPIQTTLPAIKNTDVMARDTVNIEWTSVSKLPGSQIDVIRALGKQVFNSFDNALDASNYSEELDSLDVDKIITIACMHDNPLLNEHKELNAFMHWLEVYGDPVNGLSDEIEIDFNDSIEGYKAQVKCYQVGSVMFQAVNDFMGRYIYAWESDNIKKQLENKYSEPQEVLEEKSKKRKKNKP